MKLQRLHQVAIHAANLHRSIEFYRDVLGAQLIATFDPPGLAFFDFSGVRILLEKGAPRSTLYFWVDHIDRAFEELQEQGVNFSQKPTPIHRDEAGDFGRAGEVEWMAFFSDPGGNTLALASRKRPG